MNGTVFALGLLFALVGVIWAAMVLWGLVCPSVASVSGTSKQAQDPARMVQYPGGLQCPVVATSEDPAIMAVDLPDDQKIVSLSEWRERRKRVGGF